MIKSVQEIGNTDSKISGNGDDLPICFGRFAGQPSTDAFSRDAGCARKLAKFYPSSIKQLREDFAGAVSDFHFSPRIVLSASFAIFARHPNRV